MFPHDPSATSANSSLASLARNASTSGAGSEGP